MQLSLRVVSIFCGLLSCAHGLQPNTLFSFGPVHGDTLASPNDDLSSPPIHLDREMPFYNKIQRTTLFVSPRSIYKTSRYQYNLRCILYSVEAQCDDE